VLFGPALLDGKSGAPCHVEQEEMADL